MEKGRERKPRVPYCHQLAVKVSPAMFDRIDAAVERAGLKRADFLRTIIHNELIKGERQHG